MEGSLVEAPFSARPGQPSPLNASKNFGVDRCPVKLRIPKKQKNGASQCPDPTPHLQLTKFVRIDIVVDVKNLRVMGWRLYKYRNPKYVGNYILPLLNKVPNIKLNPLTLKEILDRELVLIKEASA